jgi:hypothetical protein
MRSLLFFRAMLAVATIGCGIVVLARMLQSMAAGFAIVPGVVLAAALIALGAHRLALIWRARGMT